MRIANQKWNNMSDKKVELATHECKVKFDKRVKLTKSPIAHRRNWHENLWEKFNEARNEMQSKHRFRRDDDEHRHTGNMPSNEIDKPMKRMCTEEIINERRNDAQSPNGISQRTDNTRN